MRLFCDAVKDNAGKHAQYCETRDYCKYVLMASCARGTVEKPAHLPHIVIIVEAEGASKQNNNQNQRTRNCHKLKQSKPFK